MQCVLGHPPIIVRLLILVNFGVYFSTLITTSLCLAALPRDAGGGVYFTCDY